MNMIKRVPWAKITGKTLSNLKSMQIRCLPEDDLVMPDKSTEGHWFLVHEHSYTNIPPILIAFAVMVESTKWYDTVYMSRCCVLPEFRGKGLQKRLLRARERHARALGYTWAITDTRDNVPSSNSLISCGYKLFEPTKPWSFEDSLYWRKKLCRTKTLKRKSKRTKNIVASGIR